jgi:tRNA-dihydrouridine synthase B
VNEPAGSNQQALFRESILCLAPLAGYTDAPFRLLCTRFGADFTITEMVSADGLVRGGERTLRMLRSMEGEGPLGVQLFGSDPGALAGAAEIAESRASFIDLNFGCPVKKVIRKNGGAALMRDLDLMGRICSAVAEAVRVPVTGKIRSGWSEREENFVEAGRVMEAAGLSAVTLHPRYRSRGFAGEADWRHIARLREAVSIPVIANGDVRSREDYGRIVDVAGPGIVMVGRGALGRPWIFREIREYLGGGGAVLFGPAELVDLVKEHLALEIEWKGERTAILEMRKHYRWYLRGVCGIKRFRAELSRAESREEVHGLLDTMKKECRETWKRPA